MVLTRSSEKAMEEERAKQAMPSSDSNAGVSQPDENNPNDGTKTIRNNRNH